MSNVDLAINGILGALKKILQAIGDNDKTTFKEPKNFEGTSLKNFFIHIYRYDIENAVSDDGTHRVINDYYLITATSSTFPYPVDVIEVVYYRGSGIALKHRNWETYLIHHDDNYPISAGMINKGLRNAIQTNPDLLKMIETLPGDKNVTKRDSK